jgi:hypothetical protein
LSALTEPSFVGGEVIVSSVFSTLIAQVYFKPLLSSFVDWVTNTGQNAGEPCDDAVCVLPYTHPLPQMMSLQTICSGC